jgi:putative nucleotidyltransferase with HDIG domain
VLLCHGTCPINGDEFSRLVAQLGDRALHRPVVINRPVTDQPDWPCPQIHELILVALAEGENVFGWLSAMNHVEGGEFGTIEASLLGSVATILGIHGGNVELYRQQSDLLAGIVRALTSAIDAKDPYTCGHSDRVARVAVRLAEELGCDAKTLNMLYLAGLLHDIGKIGVDDNVLRKAGELSNEEYKHIKQHVQIGHRILNDLAKLEDILPVVLHHHEAWDGGGYPHRLESDRIPLPARIVAVADAFDAMSSNRPYRQGMPDETVDRILRAGAGQQWDPQVIDAYFRAREDIRRICQETGRREERIDAAPWTLEL